MAFRSEKQWRRLRPARLLVAALVPVALLWASGAALPGVRADLAALTPATAGAVPHAVAVTAVRQSLGVVLVAPRAGRLRHAAADGVAVGRGVRLAQIEGLAAPALGGMAAAAARALGSGGQTGSRQRLLAARAAAARSLAAADTATVVAPVAGTVRWRIPAPAGARPAPAPGQWVTAGERLGVVTPPGPTVWALEAARGALSGLRPGMPVELTPLGLRGRVTRVGAAGAGVAAGPTPAGEGGRSLALTLTWGRVQGLVVPRGALVRRGGSAWVLAAPRFAATLRWIRVSVVSAAGGRAAVAGLAPGSWVAARPWVAGLWAAWP